MPSTPNHRNGRVQVVIWVATTIFLAGIAYSSFATKEYVQQQDEKTLSEIRDELKDIKAALIRIEEKIDLKQDKISHYERVQ